MIVFESIKEKKYEYTVYIQYENLCSCFFVLIRQYKKMNEPCVKMDLTKVDYLGNTRSKVGGPINSYFYVWFINQLNAF